MSDCLNNNCIDCNPCNDNIPVYRNTKCKDSEKAYTKCVTHNGEGGLCVPFVTGENLASIIKKFDKKICDFIAGADRFVAADDTDEFPSTLQNKIADSEYITWDVQVISGVRKMVASINMEALVAEVCSQCSAIPPASTTTVAPPTTTTIPPTTTTIPPTTTTTLPQNIEVQSNVPGSSVITVVGASGFSLPQSVEIGEFITGRHNSFNGSIAVTVDGLPVGKSLILRRNGIDLQCITVNSFGTYTFDPFTFITTDICTIEYVNQPCPVTTTVPPTTTTVAPTTTIPPSTTTTTTVPINVVIQSNVSGTSITAIGGILNFNLPQSVEAGEIVTGHHLAFTGAISVNIFGVVSGAKLVLYKNGVELQCIDVNGQGVSSFSSFSFSALDTILITFIPEPCVIVPPTTTTTTLPPCRTYKLTNNTGASIEVDYKSCNGTSTSVEIANEEEDVICAIDGSIEQIVGMAVELLNISCYNCFTYEIENPIGSGSFNLTYMNCDGEEVNTGLSEGSSITVCAQKGAISGSGFNITEVAYGCSYPTTTTTVPPTTTTVAPTTTTIAPTTTTIPPTTTTVAPTTTTVPPTTTTTVAGCCNEYIVYNDTAGIITPTWTDCEGIGQSEILDPGQQVIFCAECGSASDGGGDLSTNGVCMDTPPVARIYYGTLSDGDTPTESEIENAYIKYGSITNETVLNWGLDPGTPVYYFFAIPATHATKAYWYQGPVNNGEIGTGSDLFDAHALVDVDGVSHKVYITTYATQFVNLGNYIFSVTPHIP